MAKIRWKARIRNDEPGPVIKQLNSNKQNGTRNKEQRINLPAGRQGFPVHVPGCLCAQANNQQLTTNNHMRVIAELPHPDCKITIFSMNQKYIIKLEKGVFEQIYKLSELDITDGVNGIFQILDTEFMDGVTRRFAEMRTDFNGAYKRHED